MKYTIPCLFGLEALVADELRRLDLKNVRAENLSLIHISEPTRPY